ncbi:MAG: hypothetical protein J6R12_04135 [Bacteroidales bacterium]|nr:hypothetical protein [Bacteroidales bacterium]
MNQQNIEKYLREHKPLVKDNPYFTLEVQSKMRKVKGIKIEVDRQNKKTRIALISTLFIGVIVGTFCMVLAYFHPIHLDIEQNKFLLQAIQFLENYKSYLPIPIALCAIVLGIFFSREKQDGFFFPLR